MKRYFSQSVIRSSKLNIGHKAPRLKVALIVMASFFLFNSTGIFHNASRLYQKSTKNEYSTAFGYLKLNVNSNSSNYNTEIYFNSNASQGLDPGYDSSIIGGTIPSFSIYSYLVQNNTGVPFAIQSLSETDMNNVSIPIGISANQGQEITISIAESDIPESINIYFENTSNTTSILLNNNTYSFTFDTNLLGIGNFYLRFEGDSLNNNDSEFNDIEIFANSGQKTIIIKGELKRITQFILYDINGKILITKALETKNSNQSITTTNLNKGVYIVELIDRGNQKRTQKIIIQ